MTANLLTCVLPALLAISGAGAQGTQEPGAALRQAETAAVVGQICRGEPSDLAAKATCAQAFGEDAPPPAVSAGGGLRRPDLTVGGGGPAGAGSRPLPPVPPVGEGKETGGGGWLDAIPPWLRYAGGALVGGLQGFFTGGGWVGAGIGAAMGLAGTYLFSIGQYGAAFGSALGGIIGGSMGGPVGALIGGLAGAAVGFVAQWLIGKFF